MNLEENPLDVEADEEMMDYELVENFIPDLQNEQNESSNKNCRVTANKQLSQKQSQKNCKTGEQNILKFTDTSHVLRQQKKKKTNPQGFSLTISEYEDIASRLDDSLKQLEYVRDALSTKENLKELRSKVDQTCEKLSIRANIIGFQEQRTSTIQPQIVTDIYKLDLTDVIPNRKAYLLLKYSKKKNLSVEEGAQYLIDKIKLVINKKGEIVLISTSLTVMIQYSMFKAEDEDSFDVDSLELSQKYQDEEEYYYADGQNKALAAKDENQLKCELEDKLRDAEDLAEYEKNREGPTRQKRQQGDWSGMQRANINDIFHKLEFDKDNKPKIENLQVLSSTKQIISEAKAVLQELVQEEGGEDYRSLNLWSFKDLLTWKIPEHLSSTNVNLSRSRVEAEFLPPPICLYKYNMVTQRIKEQKASFCGIVTHVKIGNWDDKTKAAAKVVQNQNKLVTSQIDMESIDDKSRVCLFVKHDDGIDLKEYVKKNQVLLIRNAQRKISTNLDIYSQLQLFGNNFKIIGMVTEEVNDFAANNRIQLLKTIPSDCIIRHIVKVCGFIVDINFIKIQYKCEVCKSEINNENVCRNGCFIKNPILNLQVLCQVQDGTTKASLELKNANVLAAFGVSEADQRRCKDYCLKYGTFMNPSSAQNFHYKDIVNVFKKYDTWNQLIFYCKPYCKTQNSKDKKQTHQNQFGGAAGGYNNYQETISKPSFIQAEQKKETEVFLNGEVNNITRKQQGQQNLNDKNIKKTTLCLKGLSVDTQLGREAVKNFYNLTNS